MKPRVKLGDIFEIPLTADKKTYGQYIYMDKRYGPLVRIFDSIIKNNQSITSEKIIKKPLLFPPIIMGIHATIREGVWKVIGNEKVIDFQYPGFLQAIWDPSTGKASKWFLWDGIVSRELGDKVPNEYKEVEYIAGYPPDLVIRRIETGEDSFKHLIETNYYRPDQLPKT